MDPLTAVGLAGSIVQFVQFSASLISEGKELYNSADGALQDNIRVFDLVKDMREMCEPLQRAAFAPPIRGTQNIVGEHQLALRKLAASSLEIAGKLIPLLESLQIPAGTEHRTWHAIRQSIRGAMHKGGIVQLNTALDMVRQQLNSRMLAFLSDIQWSSQATLQEIARSSRRMESDTHARIESARNELIQLLQNVERDSAADTRDLKQHLEVLRSEIQSGKNLQRSVRLLESLHYDYLAERESKIVESHAATLQWMFDENSTPFPRWLTRGDGAFWVTGRAGSGKSTLMKYVCYHEKTRKLLQPWIGTDQLVVAKHFFWVTGKPLEKSQEGLLRSLLYQVLKQCPNDIPLICNDRWSRNELHDFDEWTMSELSECLTRLKLLETRTKFLILIDGLDEFGGEHRSIVQMVQKLAQASHVKVCVSSRPWSAFEKAFGRSENRLLLEDLTLHDIRQYVETELSQNADFLALRRTAPQYNSLIDQISEKANGVFLWVFLVVRSLLRGLEKDDEFDDLVRRVEELPKDLHEYFGRMLENIETAYREQTSRMLLVATRAIEPLPVPALRFLELEHRSPDYAIRTAFQPITESSMKSLVSEWRRKVNNRCTDLLEVHVWNVGDQFMRARVEFLHRSVRDFLEQEEIVLTLEKRVDSEFDPLASLCRIHVALIKSLPMEQGYAAQSQTVTKLTSDFANYARSQELIQDYTDVGLIDELDRYLTQHTDHLNKHWTGQTRGTKAAGADPFLSFAFNHGLYLYAEKAIVRKNLAAQSPLCDQLLQHALGPPGDQQDKASRKQHVRFSFRIFELLLDAGIEPSRKVERNGQQPLWTAFIEWCYERETKGDWDTRMDSHCAQLIETFLRAGADPTAQVTVTEAIDVRAAVRQVLPRDQVSRIEDIMDTMVQRSLMAFLPKHMAMDLLVIAIIGAALAACALSGSTA